MSKTKPLLLLADLGEWQRVKGKPSRVEIMPGVYASQSREYASWKGMLERCLVKTNISYKNYGARGIKVCRRWGESFLNFLQDMGPRPEGCQLDRIDNNGNYEPENCQWISQKENVRKRRDVVLPFVEGETTLERRRKIRALWMLKNRELRKEYCNNLYHKDIERNRAKARAFYQRHKVRLAYEKRMQRLKNKNA